MTETPQSEDWLIVLRPDGVVGAATGGASVTWLGRRLGDVVGIPENVRKAGLELLGQSPGVGLVRRSKVSVGAVAVEILLIDALPIRRAHTRVSELLSRTIEVFTSQAHGQDIELRLERSPDVPVTMFIDGEKVAWALSTLVGSALRYVQQSKTDRRVIVGVSWDEDSGQLLISVRDNGPGMSEMQSKWLFDRDPKGQSASLALLMVRDVVACHRGSVSVESALGHGTTFVMRLPREHA